MSRPAHPARTRDSNTPPGGALAPLYRRHVTDLYLKWVCGEGCARRFGWEVESGVVAQTRRPRPPLPCLHTNVPLVSGERLGWALLLTCAVSFSDEENRLPELHRPRNFLETKRSRQDAVRQERSITGGHAATSLLQLPHPMMREEIVGSIIGRGQGGGSTSGRSFSTPLEGSCGEVRHLVGPSLLPSRC